MFKTSLLAAAVTLLAFSANAAPLSGNFNVEIRQVPGANRAGSAATVANFDNATPLTSLTYVGDIDFRLGRGKSGSTTIADFLSSGGGTFDAGITGLDNLLSLGGVSNGNGKGLSTFFRFTADYRSSFDLSIRHDDGVSIFDDGNEINAQRNSIPIQSENKVPADFLGFDGGTLSMIYVASNGNPSVLEATMSNVAPVPLPAAGWMLIAGIGGLITLARRRT